MDLEKNYFFHGIKDSTHPEETLEDVYHAGGLLSLAKMPPELRKKYTPKYIGFNGMDYISVCTKYGKCDLSECFIDYILESISFVISDRIHAVKTIYIPHSNSQRNAQDYYNLYNQGSSRYSDLDGEYQVKDAIPLTEIEAISFPITSLICDLQEEEPELIDQEIHKLWNSYQTFLRLQKEYHTNFVPIDISANGEVISEADFLKIKKRI